MREIIFRGKRIDNGEWVEGNYIGTKHRFIEDNYIIPTYSTVCESSDFCSLDVLTYFAIDPKTVCQYTGMLDANGNMIFEGDIVEYDVYCGFTYDEDVTEGRWQDKDNGVVEFKNGKFTNLPYKHNCEDYYYSYGTANHKIIGNIYYSEVVEDE